MTPAEHYAEAERLLECADDATNKLTDYVEKGMVEHAMLATLQRIIDAGLARAQVHATLAATTVEFAPPIPKAYFG